MNVTELFDLKKRNTMSAKQVLNYVANRASEEEAAAILTRAGVILQVGPGTAHFREDGQVRNEHDQIVTMGVGAITGYHLDQFEQPVPKEFAAMSNSSRQPTPGVQEAINKRNAELAKEAKAPMQKPQQHKDAKVVPNQPTQVATTLTQTGSGQTTTVQRPAVGGQHGVSTTSNVGATATPETEEKHQAVGGGVPNAHQTATNGAKPVENKPNQQNVPAAAPKAEGGTPQAKP